MTEPHSPSRSGPQRYGHHHGHHESSDVTEDAVSTVAILEVAIGLLEEMRTLHRILEAQDGLSQQLSRMEHRLMSELDDLKDAVTQNGAAIATAAQELVAQHSSIQSLNALVSQLQTAGSGTDAATLQQIADLTAQITTNNQTMAQAVQGVIDDPNTPTGDVPSPVDPSDPTTGPTVDPGTTPTDPGPVLDPTAGGGDVTPTPDPTPVDPGSIDVTPTPDPDTGGDVPSDPNSPVVDPTAPPAVDPGTPVVDPSTPTTDPSAVPTDPNAPSGAVVTDPNNPSGTDASGNVPTTDPSPNVVINETPGNANTAGPIS